MRPQSNDVDLILALVVDPGPDEVFAEHAALGEEVVVGLESVEELRAELGATLGG